MCGTFRPKRPEVNSEGLRNGKTRNDVRNEQAHGRHFIDHYDDRDACDSFLCVILEFVFKSVVE